MRRGIALVSVLIMTSILAMMVVGLILSGRSGSLATGQSYKRTQCLFAARAGVADALEALAADPTWPGVVDQPMTAVPATYTLQFRPTSAAGPYLPDESINNLAGGAATPSFYGDVPPLAALLVVTATSGGVQRRVLALVRSGDDSLHLDKAMLATGQIKLRGNISMDGVQGLNDAAAVDADVYANGSSLSWDPSGGSATIEGSVSSVGTLSMPGATITGSVTPNATATTIPRVNVLGRVNGKASCPAPAINAMGPTALATGEFFQDGDVTINGDLSLNGTDLYVRGNLTVNGTISGKGSVYVSGSTSFFGDAQVRSNDTHNVSLYSRGNVRLQGFDGTAYLEGLAASQPGTAGVYYSEAKTTLQDLQTLITTNPPESWLGNESGLGFGTGALTGTVDNMRRTLGQNDSGTYMGFNNNTLGKLAAIVEGQVPSPTRDFMAKKLRAYETFFGPSGTTAESWADLAGWLAGSDTHIFDAVMDLGHPDHVQAMINQASSLDYDKLGSSYFQGLVYTNGSIYASNDLTIIGAVVADDNGTQSPVTIGADTVNPGDLFLVNGTRLRFVQDLFDGSGSPGGGGLTVQSCLSL